VIIDPIFWKTFFDDDPRQVVREKSKALLVESKSKIPESESKILPVSTRSLGIILDGQATPRKRKRTSDKGLSTAGFLEKYRTNLEKIEKLRHQKPVFVYDPKNKADYFLDYDKILNTTVYSEKLSSQSAFGADWRSHSERQKEIDFKTNAKFRGHGVWYNTRNAESLMKILSEVTQTNVENEHGSFMDSADKILPKKSTTPEDTIFATQNKTALEKVVLKTLKKEGVTKEHPEFKEAYKQLYTRSKFEIRKEFTIQKISEDRISQIVQNNKGFLDSIKK